MKLRLCALSLILCAGLVVPCTAQQKPAPPAKTDVKAAERQKSAPVITDAQKAQVKDFQLTDANLEVQILNAQQQQKDNQARANNYISSLCQAPGGKYYLDLRDLVCKPLPTQAEVSIAK